MSSIHLNAVWLVRLIPSNGSHSFLNAVQIFELGFKRFPDIAVKETHPHVLYLGPTKRVSDKAKQKMSKHVVEQCTKVRTHADNNIPALPRFYVNTNYSTFKSLHCVAFANLAENSHLGD